MLKTDRAALRRLDQRQVEITGDVRLLPLRRLFRLVIGTPLRQPHLRCTHRHHVVEPITAIDVHERGHRAQPVRRIQVAVAQCVMRAPPQTFVAILKQNRTQIVIVRGATVLDLAEDAGANHVQHQQLVVSIAAILHHDAMPAHAFRHVHQLPAILNAVRGGYFGGGVFARLERRQAHRHVPLPRGCGIDDIDVVAQHQLFERVLIAGESGRLIRVPRIAHLLLRQIELFRHGITNSRDLHVLHAEQFVQYRATAQSGADDCHAHRVVLREWHADHRVGNALRLRQRDWCQVRRSRRIHGSRQSKGDTGAGQRGAFQQITARRIVGRISHGGTNG